MIKEDSNIVKINSEKNDFYSNDDLYNINSFGADLSFRELITMYDENELLKPELQRHYVWDKNEASRFIESLLMGLPVPSIFLARVNENKLLIDGYQRIMTVYDYVRGIWSQDEKIFRLSNSDRINKKWRGKAFAELTEQEQRRIKSTTIHAIIFEQKSPRDGDTSLFQIFERINTSGRTLMPQEIRNCVNQGIFNTALFKLNDNTTWRTLYGLANRDSRMRDIEFILRFFALKSDIIKNCSLKQISLKKHLNEFMGSEESKREEVIEEREAIFIKTIEYLYNKLGKHAFHNISHPGNSFIERFHPTIFDAISIATAYAIENNLNLDFDKRDFENRRLNLLRDDEFKLYISERTTNIEYINGRIHLALNYLYGANYE